MSNADLEMTGGKLSMRRTFLTLLGGFAAFAIVTASYATADLPDETVQVETVAVAD